MKFSYYSSGKRYIADDGNQVICIIDDVIPNVYNVSSEVFWKNNRIGSANFKPVNSEIFKHAVAKINQSLKNIIYR